MRSALALSALLLLLLLKSQTEAQPQSTDTSDTKEVTSPPAATSTVARTGAYRDPGTDAKEGAPGPTSNSAAVTDTNTNTGEGANAGTGKVPTTVKGSSKLSLTPNTTTVTAAPTQPSSAAELKHSSEEVTTITSSPVVSDAGPQDANQTQQVTTIKPSTTSIQVITQSLPTEAGEQAATSPAGVNHITSITSAPPASTNPAATGSGVPGNVSREEEDKKTSVTSSGPSPATGSTPVPSGSPSTPSAPPPDTFPGPETNSSQMPSVTETPALSSGNPSPDTVQPTDTSSSPKAVPSTGAPADTSAPLTSAVPHDIHPPPTSTSGSDRIHCVAPERFSEKMLVLNFTQTGLCAGSPPDDKLVTLLCQAAKATFNPAHDQCDIWLAPVPEIQALAIKEITIQTNLLPQDVYEVLRDKWDALKEVGVSNMQLGEQGPPEEAEDRFSMPLIITIICMASFLLLVAALYGCCHHRLSHRKDQQRLTEELQTVENGYHDNPTLEVMETSSEMQEKKVVSLNGELGDSWIVPLDNLTKDDLDEEEDTHL